MTTTVETALGTVPTAELGPTLMHEHIVTRSPGVQENWPHLWDRAGVVDIAERKMADLHARGIRTIVDLTTVDLGRDIALIADVARRSRVHVMIPAALRRRGAGALPLRVIRSGLVWSARGVNGDVVCVPPRPPRRGPRGGPGREPPHALAGIPATFARLP